MWYSSLTQNRSIAAMRTYLGAAVILVAVPGWGQSQPAGDEAAIREAGRAYIQAIQKGDVEAACATWTPEGKYIDAAGQSHKARDFVRQFVRPATNSADMADLTEAHHPSIRFVTPTVAVEEGAMVHQGQTGAASESSYSAVWVKQGDRWLLESVHESHAIPTNPLDQLGWMIGEWTATAKDIQIHCRSSWDNNRKFILRQFQIEKSGTPMLNGTQRIGWDPAAKKIRSWVFDSDGGISEGTWRKEDDNAWIVRTTGILPDGTKTSSVNFWIPEGNDRFAVKHSHVEVNGASQDDVVLEFVRVGSGS